MMSDELRRNSQDLWIGVSCDLLFASLVAGSFDEFAFLELSAGSDERYQVRCVDGRLSRVS